MLLFFVSNLQMAPASLSSLVLRSRVSFIGKHSSLFSNNDSDKEKSFDCLIDTSPEVTPGGRKNGSGL
jgi:hypothetical protein